LRAEASKSLEQKDAHDFLAAGNRIRGQVIDCSFFGPKALHGMWPHSQKKAPSTSKAAGGEDISLTTANRGANNTTVRRFSNSALDVPR
jgi:hypothetical protein